MQPEQESQKLEYVERPSLKHRAMQTNDPQRAKWSDLKGNNDQSFKDPDGGVEHGRDVNASLKTAKVRRARVSSQIFTRARPWSAPEKDDSQVSQIFMVGAKLVGN